MRASLFLLPILAVLGCDTLYGAWKQDTCTDDAGCTTSPPMCQGNATTNGTNCVLPDGGTTVECDATICSTAGCWESLCLDNLRGQDLTAVWMGRTGAAWATSKQGKIFALTLSTAPQVMAIEVAIDTPKPTTLTSIWGIDEGNIWAVGNSGIALHRNVDVWSGPDPATGIDMNDVSGNGTYFFAIGGTKLLKLEAGKWTQSSSFGTEMSGLWVTSNANVSAVGANGTLGTYTFAGGPQTQQLATTLHLNHIWGSDTDSFWVVGGDAQGGAIVLRKVGGHWTTVHQDDGPGLTGVTSIDGNTDAFAVGYGGRILHWDGQNAAFENSPTTRTLTAVAGSRTQGVWAVGENGTLLYRTPAP